MTAARRKGPDPARRAAFALAASRVRGLARAAAAGGDVALVGGNLFPDARTFGDMIHALRGRLG